jgi:GTPase
MRRPTERPQPSLPSIGNVAIVGRPNVGKSALFNRLVGRNIAIVHDQPGITRDRISALSCRGARPFTAWDTGGIVGAGETQLHAQVREAAESAMRESQLILLIVDAKQGLTPMDEELARILRRSPTPVVLVVNKIDDPKHEDLAADFARLGFPNAVSISAAHGRGIADLFELIDRELRPDEATRSDALLRAQGRAEAHPSESHEPLALAIVGKPNAGKSSLVNSIVRDERAIVSEIPGTTRDAVDIRYERDGKAYLLIDTAGIRARSKHSSSVEVFSVMRAERTIRRADLCVLVIDLMSGITSQDKKIAGLIQAARKPCLVVLNKWDLVKPKRNERKEIRRLTSETQAQLFFLDYAPMLIASALTGENVEMLFRFLSKIQKAAWRRIGTGILNRLLRTAFTENPPPLAGTRRLKLFYAAQASGEGQRAIAPPEFVLFVNDPKLLRETYERYLVARIREAEPYPGLPVLLKCRPRKERNL